MKKLDLKEFLESNLKNSWLTESGFKSYFRKQTVFHDGLRKDVLCRANTTNPKRYKNISLKQNPTSTGKYRKFCIKTELLAKEFGYKGVLIEKVLNEFLPAKLLEYGYNPYGELSFIKFFNLN